MEAFTITSDEKKVNISIDKTALSFDKLNELTTWLKLLIINDNHIPIVDKNEGEEIERRLDSLCGEDKEIAFEQIIQL